MKKSVLARNNQYKITVKQVGISLLLLSSLTACGGGGGGSDPVTGSSLSGTLQKGAFQTGATITAQELDATANPTSNSANGSVSNNLGAYTLSTSWSGWTELTVSGNYLNESTGTVSTTPITLNGIQQLNTGDVSVNVNLFSHFIAARSKYRVQNDSDALATAKAGAESELQAALSLPAVSSEQLDLHDGDGANNNANAVLLLFSGSFMAAGGDSTLLTTLTDDFKVDGVFDKANLQGIATEAGKAGMIGTLASNLSNNGVTSPPDANDLGALPDWTNSIPVANAISATTNEDTQKVITLTGTDGDGDTLSFTKVSDPAHGTVTLSGATATYTPTDNYHGSDSFTYKVNDGAVDSATATVSITVTSVNDKPVANAQSVSVTEDTQKAITLTGSDIDNDNLSYIKVSDPGHGTVSFNGATATYTPSSNYHGDDSFTFKVNDGTVDSETVTVSITVGAENDAPTANAQSVTTAEDTAKAITLTGSDPENSALSYIKVTDPENGTVSFNGATATYTPTANYFGSDSFTFKVNDGAADSTAATVSITVTAVNDDPIADAGSDVSVVEGKTITLDGTNSSDIEGSVTYSWSPATNLDDATKAQPIFTAPAVSADTEQTLTLTVTDNGNPAKTATDTVKVTVLNLPGQPQNVTATKGNAQASIAWDNVSDATGYDICMATEAITDSANCTLFQDGTIFTDASNPAAITSLTNDTTYYFVVIPKNSNGDGDASAQVSATPTGVEQPTPTGKLNDTGITLCGDYAYDDSNTLISGHTHSNSEDCANTTDAEGDPIPAGQDATSGRDTDPVTNDDSDGHKGFSFTKLDANGVALADQTGTNFSCVKDNVTGLIWEVKTDDGGLHDKDDRYTWYNTNTASNGGAVGYARQSDSTLSSPNDNTCSSYTDGVETSYCNTQAYVARVNASNSGAGLCGATDWRMPTVNELQSIADMSTRSPAIDTDYFPNTRSSLYWSGTAYNASDAWFVYFYDGDGYWDSRSYDRRVRLVRSGQ